MPFTNQARELTADPEPLSIQPNQPMSIGWLTGGALVAAWLKGMLDVNTPVGAVTTTLIAIFLAWIASNLWRRFHKSRVASASFSSMDSLEAALKAPRAVERKKVLHEGRSHFIIGVKFRDEIHARIVDVRPRTGWTWFASDCDDTSPIKFTGVEAMERRLSEHVARSVFRRCIDNEKRGLRCEVTEHERGLIEARHALWMAVSVEATGAWSGVVSVMVKTRAGDEHVVRCPLKVLGDHNFLS